MKFLHPILTSLLLISAVNAVNAESSVTGSEPTTLSTHSFLPPTLSFLRFGMTLQSFNENYYNPTPDSWRTVPAGTAFARHYDDQPFRAVSLIFDSNLKILMEVRLYFSDEAAASAYADRELRQGSILVPGERLSSGAKTADQFQRNLPGGIASLAWPFQDKVFIVATIPGTKWGPRLEP